MPVGPGLPPHQSVWSRFTRWRRRAVLDRALAILVACLRLAAVRKRRPTAAIIDTQSVKTGPQRGPRGYNANKKVKGRKRVLMVDVGGDPLGLRVVPADVQDRDALAALAPVLVALALADGEEPVLEIDVLELKGSELAGADAGLQEGHDDRVVRRSSEASYSSAILSAVAHSGDPNRLFRLALDLRVQGE